MIGTAIALMTAMLAMLAAPAMSMSSTPAPAPRAVRPIIGTPPLPAREERIALPPAEHRPAYRALHAGDQLPAYWRRDAFAITDHRRHGLPAPQPGERWSRYYDDAILIDTAGRVREARIGHDWGH